MRTFFYMIYKLNNTLMINDNGVSISFKNKLQKLCIAF